MIVHLHATCWNEERMLPFFFRHYDPLVDHYFIRDNQSTDRSLEILHAHPRVTVIPLILKGDSFVEASFAQSNRFWHPSRGKADWVAVCNVDELFWHIDLKWYLGECKRRGITFLQSKGYQMVSETFARAGEELTKKYRRGVRDALYDKPAFFNPDAIVKSGFGIARHSCNPEGRVVRPRREEILLLHYKYLGKDYVTQRHAELNARRRPRDVEKRFGFQYEADTTQTIFQELLVKRRPIVPFYQGVLARAYRRRFGPKVRARRTKRDRPQAPPVPDGNRLAGTPT